MLNLLEHSDNKQRVYVVSGNLDNYEFEGDQYDESFSIYTDLIPGVGEFVGGHFGCEEDYDDYLADCRSNKTRQLL